jgi:hypothetical protein
LFGGTGRALTELFPQQPGTSRWSGARAATVVLAVLLGAGIVLERQAGDPPWHTLWAEDGKLYLPTALKHPLSSLVTPYAGYLQLIPRLIADAAGHLLPLGQVAAGMAVAGALVASLCAIVAWYASAGHIRAPMLRFLLVASVLLLPLAPLEIANNGVNTPWYLLFAAFWALIWRPRSAAGMTVAALTCFAAGSSSPLAVAFAPLMAARLIALPRMREQAATIGWAAGIAVQVPATLVRGQGHHARLTAGVFSYYAHETVLAAVAGEHAALRLQEAVGDLAAVLIAACVLAGFVVWAFVTGGIRVRLFTAAALGLGLLFYAIVAVLRGWPTHTVWTAVPTWQIGSRYSAVPVLLIDSAAIVTVDGYLRGLPHAAGRPRPDARRTAAVLLAAVLGLSWVADFRITNLRSANTPPPLSMAALASLRATPSTLVTRLAAMDSTANPVERDQFAFAALGQLCRNYALPRPLAAEVYHALADVPGVTIFRHFRDSGGRTGVGFRDRVVLGNGEGHAVETIVLNHSGHQLMSIQYAGFGPNYQGPKQIVILR